MNARHEFKHPLNHADFVLLRKRLLTVLPCDAHADCDGEYLVRSLYFDTPGDKALREKIDGVNEREKFRIRYYNGNTDFLRLEKKSKRNGLCYKASAPISAEQAEALLRGDLRWMKTHGDPLVLELYTKMQSQLLRPKTIVDYLRTPFIYRPGNVRITLDRQIRSGRTCVDFLRADVPMASVGDMPALLEVKYDAFIPDFIVGLLQIGDRRSTAFSKYAQCRVYG